MGGRGGANEGDRKDICDTEAGWKGLDEKDDEVGEGND